MSKSLSSSIFFNSANIGFLSSCDIASINVRRPIPFKKRYHRLGGTSEAYVSRFDFGLP